MKVLIAADIFPPDIGGPATYVVDLAHGLMARGVDLKIVCLNPEADTTTVPCPVKATRGRKRWQRYFWYLIQLWQQAKEVDCLYAMGPVNAGGPAWLVARLRGRKLVVKIVGDYAWEQGQGRFKVTQSLDEFQNVKNGLSPYVRFLRWIQRQVSQRADLVIVPSGYLKKIVQGWGVKSENIQVIYNAARITDQVPAASKPENEKWVVTIGRFTPWKGINTLVEVVGVLAKDISGLKLIAIGSGPEWEAVKTLVQEKNLGNYIQLTGALSHAQTLSYLASADVFVLNSGYEGLSHVILEALALQVPVLASAVGGNAEAVGDFGRLFPYDDRSAIKKLIQMTLVEEVEKSGDCKGHLRRFSLDTMLSRTQAALQNICR